MNMNVPAFVPGPTPFSCRGKASSYSFLPRHNRQINNWSTCNNGNLRIPSMTSSPASSPTFSPAQNSLVDILLQAVEGTDRGAQTSKTERENVRMLIEQLLASSGPPPDLTDPRLFGCFSILYTLVPPSQKYDPAGGLLRSPLGRLIFQTKGIFQHFIQPNVIFNVLAFRFLGLFSGAVSLRGIASVDSDDTSTDPSSNTKLVKISFDRPRTRLGPAVFEYGPETTARLTFCYVDDRIRIGRGKRGSLILFGRQPADVTWPEADEWKSLFAAKPWPTFIIPLVLLSIAAAALLAPLPIRVFVIIFVLLLAFLLRRSSD